MRNNVLIFVLVLIYICFTGPALVSEEKPELPDKYKKWMEEEVVYIISEYEKSVLKNLPTDEQRERFIKMFWKRRDPTPETPFNEFREEHYRRINFANKNYFEGRTGWRTDRGRIYIMFGPPDFFETNPGGAKGFLFEQASTAEYPSEVWTYRYIPGVRSRMQRVDFMFIDQYANGEYKLSFDPALANALRNISIPSRYAGYGDFPGEEPAGGLSTMRLAEQARDLTGMNPLEKLYMMAEFTKSRGEVLEEMERSARVRRLKGVVEARESLNQLSFNTKESFLSGGEGFTYVPISVEVAGKDLRFEKKKDAYLGLLNFYIEIKDAKDETVYTASDRLEMTLREETYQRRVTDYYQYKHGFSLRPGDYFIHLVVWDEFNKNVGYLDKKLTIPGFVKDEYGLSEVILANDIRVVEVKTEEKVIKSEDVPALKSLEGTELKIPDKIKIREYQNVGPYTFGNLEVFPNTLGEYRKDEELAFFYQIYNPTYDVAKGGALLYIEHQIWKGDVFVGVVDRPQKVKIPFEQKMVAVNSGATYNLSALQPGTYYLLIRVRDVYTDRKVEKRIKFKVKSIM